MLLMETLLLASRSNGKTYVAYVVLSIYLPYVPYTAREDSNRNLKTHDSDGTNVASLR